MSHQILTFQLKIPESPNTVTLTNIGASVLSVMTPDREGELGEITTSVTSPEDLLDLNTCFGATCGRVANRIKHGRFKLGGDEYKLAINNGPHSNHGGDAPFHYRIWDVESHSDSSVTFSLFSPDGDGGFPGNLNVRACYTLLIDGSLKVEYSAKTDGDTLINLTNHTYWNLSRNNRSPLREHEISVAADHYLPVDSDHLVTGEILPVEGTCFDLRKFTRLGPLLDSDSLPCGLDNTFPVLNLDGGELALAARLHDPVSEKGLEVWTDQPGIHVYSGHFLPDPYEGIAFESQKFPDAPNHADFPSIVLKKGSTYLHNIIFKFSK